MWARGAVLNLASTCNCAIIPRQFPQRALFPTIMMGDDRAMAAVYVAGKTVLPHRHQRAAAAHSQRIRQQDVATVTG
jgi:hypothetical protein